MHSSSTHTKIAKNSLILYVKLLVNIILGLITSRYVLQALGASSYGLYNVVAGVLTMITFISSSMSETTTRYINYELGRDRSNVNNIFNTCQVIHILFAFVILLFAETLGVFYVRNYLKVSPGMENVAMFVFQISTISACFGITNAPYQGLLIAKEKFATLAKAEILNMVLKLLFVVALFLITQNRLQVYSISMVALTLVLFVRYHYICYKKWPDIVRWNVSGIKIQFKEIFSFNNYNILATGAQIVKNQGANMIINYFYGTILNAAYSIAFTLQNYVSVFMNSFGYAAAPQITQNIGSGNKEQSYRLATVIGKVSILMSMIAVFPLISESGLVLNLWLTEVPPYTEEFVNLILIYALIGASSTGIVQIINGIGKIKWYKIQFAILCLGCLPLIIYAIKHGDSPTIVLKIFIGVEVLSRLIQLTLLRTISNFNSIKFIKEAYLRPGIIAIVVIIQIFLLHQITPNTDLFKFLNIITTFFITAMLSYIIGLTRLERKTILEIIRQKL